MAKWVWYYGDFELYHHRELSLSRVERGKGMPPFWKIYDCHRNAEFGKTVELAAPECLRTVFDGIGYLTLDGVRMRCDKEVLIPAGQHSLTFSVANPVGIPAVWAEGETFGTDETWLCGEGIRSAGSLSKFDTKAGTWDLCDPEERPSDYQLPAEPIEIVSVTLVEGGELIDFGKEVYARITLEGAVPGVPLKLVYGESIPEAMSEEHAVRSIKITPKSGYVELKGAACRYVRILGEQLPEKISAACELLPLEKRGSFSAEDPQLTKIWNTCEYTLHLNSRLFYLDGIKRDGWVWSGDAYQSYLLNYYCHFDKDIIKRTTLALRGGDPIACHINTILDYSFFWFMGLREYLCYTGDRAFICEIYDRAKTLMEYCVLREGPEGLVQGLDYDWTFIDWADMRKDGALCAEQMLYCAALESMSLCAEVAGHKEEAALYVEKAAALRKKITELYWNEEAGAYLTAIVDGEPVQEVRRHQNILAVLLDFAEGDRGKRILTNVLENEDIPPITTPYFKLYEMEALCRLGRTAEMISWAQAYWGGMLKLGATTFWEEFDPQMSGDEHLAMYGEPYDKSLCHAWAAGPIYLFGRYLLGVAPTGEGYSTFEVQPALDAGNFTGTVPTPQGDISVEVKDGRCIVRTALSGGVFIRGEERYPIIPNTENRF